MPRRILENWYYHIYNRWVEKKIIFKNEENFEKFYKLIASYSNNEKYSGIKILAFCLIPNHFHLIIDNSLKDSSELSNFMWNIQNAYSKYFNIKNKSKWQLFEWRFKAKKINNNEYLRQAISYVCFNPVKHNIVKNIDDYKWTSYHQIDKNKIEKYKDLSLDELEI